MIPAQSRLQLPDESVLYSIYIVHREVKSIRDRLEFFIFQENHFGNLPVPAVRDGFYRCVNVHPDTGLIAADPFARMRLPILAGGHYSFGTQSVMLVVIEESE